MGNHFRTGGDGAHDDDDRYPHLGLSFLLREGAFRREAFRREQGRREQRHDSPVDPYAGAIVLAAAYYAYCVYGKSTRSNDKETEPLMPVATATPMT